MKCDAARPSAATRTLRFDYPLIRQSRSSRQNGSSTLFLQDAGRLDVAEACITCRVLFAIQTRAAARF
jgi:hypothetical protein